MADSLNKPAGHDHNHAPASYIAAFALGIGLNIAFVAIEAFYGWKVNSLALLADAGYNLSDVIGLVLAGGLALWFGWNWLDPVVSLAIAAVIVVGTWSLFRQSLHLMFDGVPDGVDLHAVQALLQGLPGVAQVHDLHVWAMGTSEIALTAPLVMPQGGDDAFLKHATDELHEHFEIRHVTLQVVREVFCEGCAALPPGGDASAQRAAAKREDHDNDHDGGHTHTRLGTSARGQAPGTVSASASSSRTGDGAASGCVSPPACGR